LEADKFSGYVLQKMGAPLAEAQRMIMTIGSSHGSATHPAKEQRAASIRQGWIESCTQAGGLDCSNGKAPPPSTSATPGVSGSTAAGDEPALPGSVAMRPTADASVPARALPTPGSIPFKYGRFIVDETGRLDLARVKTMEQRLYGLAKNSGAEMSILVVNDLKGRSAEDYAWAMMRQLRIGKLDVGNGAVAVVAPRQHQAAVAFGPGLAKEAEFSDPKKQLLRWIDAAWPNCEDADGCAGWSDALFGPFNGTLFWAERSKWTIDYQSLGQLLNHYSLIDKERQQTKRAFNPETDQPNGNLLRVSGRITSLKSSTGLGRGCWAGSSDTPPST
jgi:hypothetical protein